MSTLQPVSPGRRRRRPSEQPVATDARTEALDALAKLIKQVKAELDGLELRGEHAEASKRLDTFAALLRAKLYVDGQAVRKDGDGATEDLLKTRSIRKSYEACATFSERLQRIYIQLVHFVEEARISDRDLFWALEMLCRDYDDEVENLSISWAHVHTAWRGNRDE